MRLLTLFVILILNNLVFSQTPAPDFIIPEEACYVEIIQPQNTSTGSIDSYEWDFCGGSFSDVLNVSHSADITSISRNLMTDYIQINGVWYGIATSWGNHKLYRLTFSNGLGASPTSIVDLGNPGNLLNQPVSIGLVEESGVLYALVHNWGNRNLIRIRFNNGITDSSLTGSVVHTLFGESLSKMEIIKTPSELKAVIVNTNSSIQIIDFHNNINRTITSSDIITTGTTSGMTGVREIEMINVAGNWHAFIASYTSGKIARIDFGSNLMTGIKNTQLDVTTNIYGGGNPNNIEIIKFGSEYHLHVLTFQGTLYKVNLGKNITNSGITSGAVQYGTSGLYAQGYNLKFIKHNGDWHGYIVNDMTAKLYYIKHTPPCVASISYSIIENPNITYSQSGTFEVELTAHTSTGPFITTKQITVTSSEAPTPNFTTSNTCISSPNTFTSSISNNQTITSYSWNFGDGNTSTGQNPSHQYAAPGTYKVRLNVVSENGCKNFIEKEVTIYPEPVPDFTFPAGVICTNGEVNFNNTTPGEFGGLISYEWDFGDDNTSTLKNPTHTYATGGTKTVTLKASIPGCYATQSYELNILSGPSVNFTTSNLCLGELVQFTDASTGEGITKYDWDLGNGYVSTLKNPTIIYDDPGTYQVTLTVENASGCRNTFTQAVTIHALPNVNFINELSCSGTTTQFLDKTTIANANIASWLWEIDGTQYDVKDPVHVFAQPGNYHVKLTIESNFGCKSSLTKQVTVVPAPAVDFNIQPGCVGNLTRFTDNTSDHGGSEITGWYWLIDNKEFFTKNVDYQFKTHGTYDVRLTVTSSSFCQATVTKQVTIYPLPAPDFTYTPACAGDPILFTEESGLAGDDVITGWKWQFDNGTPKTGKEVSHTFQSTGNHSATLEITTERGCILSVTKTILVTPVPQVSFKAPAALGAPPLTIDFENTSSGENSYTWFFGDASGSTSTEVNPTFTYHELGSYEIKLVAVNSLGCTDTSKMTINLMNPILDVALEQVHMVEAGEQRKVVLKLLNKGSLPITEMDIFIDLGGGFSFKESFSGKLMPLESVNYPLKMEIQAATFQRLPYICVTLEAKHPEFTETNTTDNKACFDKQETFTLFELGPNPSSGEIKVSYLLPGRGTVAFSLHNNHGAMLMARSIDDARAGYNTSYFDLQHLHKGLYFLVITFDGQKVVRRVVKE